MKMTCKKNKRRGDTNIAKERILGKRGGEEMVPLSFFFKKQFNAWIAYHEALVLCPYLDPYLRQQRMVGGRKVE